MLLRLKMSQRDFFSNHAVRGGSHTLALPKGRKADAVEAAVIKPFPVGRLDINYVGEKEQKECDDERSFCSGVGGCLCRRIYSRLCTRRLRARCWPCPRSRSWRLCARSYDSSWEPRAADANLRIPKSGPTGTTLSGAHRQWAAGAEPVRRCHALEPTSNSRPSSRVGWRRRRGDGPHYDTRAALS
jgi:hypothetical protein